MAALPNTVTSDGNAPGPINQYLPSINVQTSPDMFGAARARAIGEAGQALDRVMAVGTRIVVNEQEIQNETQATEQATEYTRRANEAYGAYSQLRGQNAVNGYEAFLDQLRTIREETMGNASNPAMRRMLNARVSSYETGILAGGARYHGQQVQGAALQAQQSAAEGARTNAVLFRNDEARVNQEVGIAEAAIVEAGRIQGWDGGTVAVRLAEERGRVIGGAVRALMDDDPIRAQELFNRNRERLDGASVLAIGNSLEAPVRARQAQNIVQGVIGGGQNARNVIFRAENPAGDARRNATGESSASGPGQITDGMWSRYATRLGLQSSQRNERGAHEQIFDAYINDVQTRMGRQLSGPEQYAAWFLGEGAFVAFTNAAPNSDAREVYLRAVNGNEQMADRAFRSNGDLLRPGMTTQQVLNAVGGRFMSTAARMGIREDGTVGRRDRASMLQEVIARTEHDPRLQTAAIAQFNQRMSVMDASQGQERAAVTRDVREMDQALRTGNDQVTPSTLEPRVRSLFDREQADDIMAGLRTSEVAGQVFRSVNLATPEQIRNMEVDLQQGTGELSTLLRRLRGVRVSEDGTVHPDDRAGDVVARQDMRRILAERTQARSQQLHGDRADPAQYAQQLDPTVGAAAQRMQADPNDRDARAAYVAASRASQERLGVAPTDVRVLTRAQSEQMAQRIMQLDPAEANITQALGALRQQWGEAFPNVLHDMVRDARLPASIMIAANVTTPTAQADMTRMTQWAAQNGGMEALRRSLPTATRTEIERGTSTEGNDTLNNFARSLNVSGSRGAQQLAVQMREQVQNLATYYAHTQGMTPAQAVQQATDRLITDQYEFEGDFRLPRRLSNGQTLSMAQIRPAFNSVRMGLTATDLQPLENPGGRYSAEQVAERTLTSAQRGMWVTNQNESGAVLFRTLDNGVNVPVRRADGSFVQIAFNNIPEVGAPERGEANSVFGQRGAAGGFYPDAPQQAAPARPLRGRPQPPPVVQPAPPAAAGIEASPQRALPGAEPARTRRPSGRWLPEPPQ